jgi:hypothetical protein
VAWPVGVSYTKKPYDWTVSECWRLGAWLGQVGAVQHTEYVSADFARIAEVQVANLDAEAAHRAARRAVLNDDE